MTSSGSKNRRHATNVGVGTLRDPNDEHFTVNQGWDPSQVHFPDDSVIDSVDFETVPDNKSDLGPHTFTLPKLPNMFLDTSTLRVVGKAKIVYFDTTKGEETKLPKNADLETNPWETPSVELLVDDTAKDTNTPYIESVTTAGSGAAATHEFTKKYLGLMTADVKYSEKKPKVAPINHFCQSMWKDITVFMNGNQITKNTNLEYPIRTYLENLLYYGTEAQKTHMSTEMWYPDIHIENEDNPAYWKKTDDFFKGLQHKGKSFHYRRNKYCTDKEFDFVFSMHTELNTINSFIYDGINYSFVFKRNTPDFCLQAENLEPNGRYIIRLTDLRLKGRYMIPSPKIEKALQSFINRSQARYATRRNQVYTAFVNKGMTDFNYHNIFTQDVLPDQIFMVMTTSKAKNGSLDTNPWYFEHFDADRVELVVNERSLPKNGHKPDFANNLFTECYRELFDNIGVGNNNIGVPITPLKFKHGYTIFAWDLNHDKCAGAHNNHSKMNGICDINIHFSKPLENPIAVTVFGIYRDYLTLDNERFPNVMSSYGVGAIPSSVWGA